MPLSLNLTLTKSNPNPNPNPNPNLRHEAREEREKAMTTIVIRERRQANFMRTLSSLSPSPFPSP